MARNPIQVLSKYTEEFGDTFQFYLGGLKEAIVSIDPAVIQHVLKTNGDNYQKSEIQVKRMGHFLGIGLLTTHGEPWKTQELTRKILKLMYGSDRFGLAFPGMDDQGSTSSWYVMSAMGFYPVDPSSPDYIMGSPIFSRVVIHMGNGKDLEIVAHNNSDKNIYIESAMMNDKPWSKPWFSHADIANGAKLVLEMGSLPNKNWGAAPDAAPPSMSQRQ